MRATGYVLAAAAIAAVVVLALVWSFGRSPNPVAAPPSRSASPTASPSATASASATRSASTTPPAAATIPTRDTDGGTITGRLGYPSELVPPLTIYAISVNDPNVWFSTTTPVFGSYTGPSPTPTPAAATWPPSGPGTFQLNVLAGTYYVVAFIDKSFFGGSDKPAVYSRYTVDCVQASQGGQNSTPAPGCKDPADHSLIAVTVSPGGTVSRVDMVDWYALGGQGTYPPRPTPRP